MKENNSKFCQSLVVSLTQVCDTPILIIFILSPHSVPDMDQLYEQWLQSQKPGWGEETSSNSVRENGKQIHMPTDYAEEVVSGKIEWLGRVMNADLVQKLVSEI